jgi:ketosteroid isomerase-like protein
MSTEQHKAAVRRATDLKTLFAQKLERSAIAMTIENMIAEGDYVAEQARGKARTLDGQDYNNVYCRVWRFRDGKIAALTEYMDTELARRCIWDS